MISPEIFYLHIDGEQRGPYTVPQIDHLLNSGLIAEETLYWREGLEQWQPVTSLVKLRRRGRPWGKIVVVAGVILILAFIAEFFGSVAILGWREANQHEYTARAAYWRARGIVRSAALPPGTVVEFRDFADTKVELQAPHEATVQVQGEVTEQPGQERQRTWNVRMEYEPNVREWNGDQPQEITP